MQVRTCRVCGFEGTEDHFAALHGPKKRNICKRCKAAERQRERLKGVEIGWLHKELLNLTRVYILRNQVLVPVIDGKPLDLNEQAMDIFGSGDAMKMRRFQYRRKTESQIELKLRSCKAYAEANGLTLEIYLDGKLILSSSS